MDTVALTLETLKPRLNHLLENIDIFAGFCRTSGFTPGSNPRAAVKILERNPLLHRAATYMTDPCGVMRWRASGDKPIYNSIDWAAHSQDELASRGPRLSFPTHILVILTEFRPQLDVGKYFPGERQRSTGHDCIFQSGNLIGQLGR